MPDRSTKNPHVQQHGDVRLLREVEKLWLAAASRAALSNVRFDRLSTIQMSFIDSANMQLVYDKHRYLFVT
jgi:hypothetical protein